MNNLSLTMQLHVYAQFACTLLQYCIDYIQLVFQLIHSLNTIMTHLLPSSQLIHTKYILYYDMSINTHVNIDIRASAIDIWEEL